MPASDVPEERTAATQPFPSKPASLVAQTVTEADVWGVTPAEREACLARFRTLRYDGVFTPPSGGLPKPPLTMTNVGKGPPA